MVREEEHDVEPRDEVEEEESRDKAVLRRDQVKNERADAGESLAQTQAMLPEQFVLQKIVLRSVPAKRFEGHAENEERAIDTVAPPGQLRPGGAERHHHPDAEPEEA